METNKQIIYLDNNATTPIDKVAVIGLQRSKEDTITQNQKSIKS
jgi:hypothetical protein